jgi:hypothetical protein
MDDHDGEEHPVVRFADVVDWIDGRLDDGAAAQVAAAVAADAELARSAEWYRTFRAASERMVLHSPPQEIRDLLMRRFTSSRPAAPGILERVHATVAFDSATAQLAFGVRAADTGAVRHLVAESGTVDVALDLYPEDREVRVEGQLLPADPDAPAHGTVRLVRDGTELAVTEADDGGRFAFSPVAPGGVLLVVTIDGVLIEADVSLEV